MQARPNLQSASSVGNNVALPSVTFAQTNAKNIFPVATGALSAEASSSVTSNLIATLKVCYSILKSVLIHLISEFIPLFGF